MLHFIHINYNYLFIRVYLLETNNETEHNSYCIVTEIQLLDFRLKFFFIV